MHPTPSLVPAFEPFVPLGCSQVLLHLFPPHLFAFLLLVLQGLEQLGVRYSPLLHHLLLVGQLPRLLVEFLLAFQEVVHEGALLLLLLRVALALLRRFVLLPLLQHLEDFGFDDDVVEGHALDVQVEFVVLELFVEEVSVDVFEIGVLGLSSLHVLQLLVQLSADVASPYLLYLDGCLLLSVALKQYFELADCLSSFVLLDSCP